MPALGAGVQKSDEFLLAIRSGVLNEFDQLRVRLGGIRTLPQHPAHVSEIGVIQRGQPISSTLFRWLANRPRPASS